MIPSRRISGLDGMRAIAILCVLFSHSEVSGNVPHHWLIDQLRRVFSGTLGVQIFFTISGFIITLLLCKEQASHGHISLRRFWLRRSLRILPPASAYLLFLHFVGRQNQALVPSETQWGSLLFYRNMMPFDPWFTTQQGFTGHYWSLAVEEQFYLIWPLLVAFLAVKQLRRLSLVGIVISVVFRIAIPWLPDGSLRWLPMNLDGFMAGALLALNISSGHTAPWLRIWHKRTLLLFCALLLTRLSGSSIGHWFTFIQPLAVAAATSAYIAGLAMGCKGSELRLLNWTPLVGLGLISYSVYLWQQVLLAPEFQWLSGQAPWLCLFPQNILMCIICGSVSYWGIEQPFNKIKERLTVIPPVPKHDE